ncbi:MAG TPA: hypothetical protein VK484_13615, partial [Ferruginibacter sp.]|nr:hypothetical protein [Ferruginibacter sp.]
MNIKDYIASGILEAYCLGFVTEREREEVEHNAVRHLAIKEELMAISDSLERYAVKKGMQPKTTVKTKLLLLFYEDQAGPGKKYPPLIKKDVTVEDFRKWLSENGPGGYRIDEPAEAYDNLASVELPSTETVTNFMVWAKKGHEEEMHTSFNEFIVILKGHCDMYFDGEKR